MSRTKKKLLGFTLIEMLIVMTIFIILFGITISAFSGLRNTILMNETVESIKRNFRWTQRSALLLKRSEGEGWVYGIGIDLTEYYQATIDADQLRSYKIFKWCAPCTEYNGCPGASSEIPGDAGAILEDTKLPADTDNTGMCTGYIPSTGKITYIGGSPMDDVRTTGLGLVDNFDIPKPLRIGTTGSIRYVLFESVTGRVFYYDGARQVVSPYTADGSRTNPALELQFVISPPKRGSTEYGILMKQNGFSGKISTEQINNLGSFTVHTY